MDESRNIVTAYGYDANRNRVLIQYGEATAGRDPNNIERTAFDERDLPFTVTRAPGTQDQSTTQYDYDLNRNRKLVSQGTESSPRLTSYVYDGYNRRTATTDAMGTLNRTGGSPVFGRSVGRARPVAAVGVTTRLLRPAAQDGAGRGHRP